MNLRKRHHFGLRMHWTCCDLCHAEHRSRVAAWLHWLWLTGGPFRPFWLTPRPVVNNKLAGGHLPPRPMPWPAPPAPPAIAVASLLSVARAAPAHPPRQPNPMVELNSIPSWSWRDVEPASREHAPEPEVEVEVEPIRSGGDGDFGGAGASGDWDEPSTSSASTTTTNSADSE